MSTKVWAWREAEGLLVSRFDLRFSGFILKFRTISTTPLSATILNFIDSQQVSPLQWSLLHEFAFILHDILGSFGTSFYMHYYWFRVFFFLRFFFSSMMGVRSSLHAPWLISSISRNIRKSHKSGQTYPLRLGQTGSWAVVSLKYQIKKVWSIMTCFFYLTFHINKL